ncbi:MAG: DUF494 family protein [Deferribacterota bacterium]|nr:DUF494 family protein [Deferribacterota bacterium]
MSKIAIALHLIIDFIENNEKIKENDVVEVLSSSGFEDYEIRQTLSIFNFNNNTTGIRYFTTHEKIKLSNNARLYLQKLLFSGLIDVITMEQVLEKIDELDDNNININQIKQIVMVVLIEENSHIFKNKQYNDNILH